MKRFLILFIAATFSLFPLSARKKTLLYYSNLNKEKTINIEVDWKASRMKDSSLGYDENLAKISLVLSRSIYISEEVFEKNTKKLGFTKLLFHDSKNDISQPVVAFGYQKHWGVNYYLIVVRGTASFDDFLTDLKSQFDYFKKSAEFVYDEFINYTTSLLKKDEEQLKKDNNIFLITGHSLGGAVSNILSKEMMAFTQKNKIFTYTFESPSTGAPEEEKSISNSINIINNNDFVPSLPVPESRYGFDICYNPDDLDESIYEYISSSTLEKLKSFGPSNKWNNHLLDCGLCYILSREEGKLKTSNEINNS